MRRCSLVISRESGWQKGLLRETVSSCAINGASNIECPFPIIATIIGPRLARSHSLATADPAFFQWHGRERARRATVDDGGRGRGTRRERAATCGVRTQLFPLYAWRNLDPRDSASVTRLYRQSAEVYLRIFCQNYRGSAFRHGNLILDDLI